MSNVFTFLIGLLVGMVLTAVAVVWGATHDKPKLVWMDQDYKLHLVKRKRK